MGYDRFHDVFLVVAGRVEGEFGGRVARLRIELVEFPDVIDVLSVRDDVEAVIVVLVFYCRNFIRTTKLCRQFVLLRRILQDDPIPTRKLRFEFGCRDVESTLSRRSCLYNV